MHVSNSIAIWTGQAKTHTDTHTHTNQHQISSYTVKYIYDTMRQWKWGFFFYRMNNKDRSECKKPSNCSILYESKRSKRGVKVKTHNYIAFIFIALNYIYLILYDWYMVFCLLSLVVLLFDFSILSFLLIFSFFVYPFGFGSLV